MPRIREYESKVSAEGSIPNVSIPSARLSNVGIREFGAAAGEANQRLEEHASRLEVTEAHTLLAKAQADWSNHLRDRVQKTKPGELFADKFNEDVASYIDKARNNFQTIEGQQEFERGAAALAANFVAESGAQEAKLIGARAVQNFKTMVDSYQIVVDNDPTKFDMILSQLNSAIDDPGSMFARLDPGSKDAAKRDAITQLANSTMESIVRDAPKLAKKYLENPETNPAKYLTGEQLGDLKDKAEAGIERQATAADREYQIAKREKEDRLDAIEDSFIARTLNPTEENGGIPSDAEIAAAKLDARRMITVDGFKARRVDELAARAKQEHPSEVRRLHLNMIAEANSPDKTYSLEPAKESYRNGGLNTDEYLFLEARFHGLRDSATNSFEQDSAALIGSAGNLIQGSLAFIGQPDLAINAVSRMNYDFYQKANELRQNNEDPRILLKPGTKDHFFAPENMSTYMVPSSQALATGAASTLVTEAVGRAPKRELPNYGDFSTLSSGAIFIGPDGEKRVKTRTAPQTVVERRKGTKAKQDYKTDSEVLPKSSDIHALKLGTLFTDPKGDIFRKTKPTITLPMRRQGLPPLTYEEASERVDISELIPGAAAAKSSGAAPVKIKTAEDYNALPVGAVYIAPDGRIMRKKEKNAESVGQ